MSEGGMMETISRAARASGWAAGTIAALVVLAFRHEVDHYHSAPRLEQAAIGAVLAVGTVALVLAAFL